MERDGICNECRLYNQALATRYSLLGQGLGAVAGTGAAGAGARITVVVTAGRLVMPVRPVEPPVVPPVEAVIIG